MILIRKLRAIVILLSLVVISGSFYTPQSSIVGAWHWKAGDDETVLICTNSHIVITEFNQVNTQFVYCSGGGNYTYKDARYTENIECYAKDSYKVGTSVTVDATLNENAWINKGKGMEEEWRRE